MIHPTTDTKAAAGNKGKPTTLQTVVTTSKQDQAKIDAEAKAAATTKEKAPVPSILRRINEMFADAGMAGGIEHATHPEQNKNAENMRKDSKTEAGEGLALPSKGAGKKKGAAKKKGAGKKDEKMDEKKDEKKEANDKKPAGTGELKAAYESDSDEYSDGSEDDVNDEYDDTARPGQSATQYGWL